MTNNPTNKKRNQATMMMALLLCVIAFIAYANTLKNGFVLDDQNVIVNNTIVTKGVSAIPEILSTPYRRGYAAYSNDLYRPLSLIMFTTEYQLFGAEPMPFHLLNVLVFMGCVMLLFLFLDLLFERKRTAVAFIAALLFALHPIHTEVVANIKSLDELLCFLFAFLSVYLLLQYLRGGKIAQLLSGIGCFFLALLAKETALTFLAIIPLVTFCFANAYRKRSVYVITSVVLTAIVFIAIRYAVLAAYNAGNTGNVSFLDNELTAAGLDAGSRIATAILILGYYIRLLIVPYPLISDYSFNAIPFARFSDIGVLLTIAVYAGLIVLAIMRIRKNKKDPYAFAIFFLLITISIFSNLFVLIGSGMAERFLFFPSVGFCIAAAFLINKLAGGAEGASLAFFRQPKVLSVAVPVLLIYAVITIDRNSDWVSDYVLFSTDVKNSRNNSRLNYYVGSELQNTILPQDNDPASQQAVMKEAIDYFSRAVAIYPEFPDAHANLGFMYFHAGMPDSAEVHDKLALQYKPVFPSVVNNLAEVYFHEKKYGKAVDLYINAIESTPTDMQLYANLTTCLGSMGSYDSAIYYAHAGLIIDPSFTKLYENIALCYKLRSNMDSANKYAALARGAMK